MSLKPLKEYKNPEFPEMEKAKTKPGFLNRFIPEKWQKGIALSGAAVMLFAGGFAMNSDIGSIAKTGIVVAAERDWGRTAGVVAVPRTFVTEAEAKKIVMDEMAKHQVKFDKTDYKIESKESGKTLNLDGYSSTSKIGFKVITNKQWLEIRNWSGDKNLGFETNQEAASYLEKKLMEQNKLRCLVVSIPEYDVNKEASVRNITDQINKFVNAGKPVKGK